MAFSNCNKMSTNRLSACKDQAASSMHRKFEAEISGYLGTGCKNEPEELVLELLSAKIASHLTGAIEWHETNTLLHLAFPSYA